MRFVLEIGDRSIAIIDTPNMRRAAALVRSDHLGDQLKDSMSNGVPLWDGKAHRSFRPATADEEKLWQVEHSRNNAELGLGDDQGLCIWLVAVDNSHSKTFSLKDEWKLW
jgi:hypothetical protein